MPVPRLHKYQHKVDVNKLKLDGVYGSVRAVWVCSIVEGSTNK